MKRDDLLPAVGLVAIGRNEGERLRRCLESVRQQCASIVYVDSGSTDGSVQLARGLGAAVVDLDLSTPFTAARARNEGLRRLRELRPDVEFVQFIDGDCELVAGWIAAGLAPLLERAELAVVCGRRRERSRNATIYNRLCDIEWNTPVGEVEACGGDALMRVAPLESVGGYDSSLIAGEEPDLCRRLRARGAVILRVDAEMTLHDAAMTRASQWWRRTLRGGYCAAESLGRLGAGAPSSDRRCVRGAVLWIVALPLLILIGLAAAAFAGSGKAALLIVAAVLASVLAQTLRIAARRDSRGESAGDRLLYAASCMAGKLPQFVGMLQHLSHRVTRTRARLIEYK